jgi:hypothetical protein
MLNLAEFEARGLLLSVCLLLLPACAMVSPAVKQAQPVSAELPQAQDQAQDQDSTDEQSYWWYVPVQMVWLQGQPIAWHMDVLLAHQLFKPILLDFSDDIELWRFHRRAARNKAGHRFSFIFYARKASAVAILNRLAENTLIPKLLAANRVKKIYLHERNKRPSPAIEATSDKNWSQSMQRAWPYFAMGVSQVWLSLVDQHVTATARGGENSVVPNLLADNDVDALLRFYEQIDEKMVATWETEGGHALLHHLNAIFGYGEVAIYERRMIRF